MPASYELTGIERGYVLQASNCGGTGDYGYHLKYNESVVEGSGALQLSNFGEVEVACDVALGLTDEVRMTYCLIFQMYPCAHFCLTLLKR